MKTIIHVRDWAAPPDRVFEALTTLTGLAAWWTTKVTGDAGRQSPPSRSWPGEHRAN